MAKGGGRPTPTTGHPGAVVIARVLPVSADRAYVIDDSGVWFATPDRGASWSRVTDPCAGTPGEASTFDTLAVASGGALWLVCAGEPAGSFQPKQVRVSTNGGTSWTGRGGVDFGGHGTSVHPVSATVAWRTGGRSPIYRTTDGSTWMAVAHPPDGPFTFAVVDASTAIYTETVESGGRIVYVTVDGGRTWTPRPLSP